MTYDLVVTETELGTFYLTSPNSLPDAYIASTCNTATHCYLSEMFAPSS